MSLHSREGQRCIIVERQGLGFFLVIFHEDKPGKFAFLLAIISEGG